MSLMFRTVALLVEIAAPYATVAKWCSGTHIGASQASVITLPITLSVKNNT